MRRQPWRVTLNRAFEEVIDECATIRAEHEGTWITEPMREAYIELHRKLLALDHSKSINLIFIVSSYHFQVQMIFVYNSKEKNLNHVEMRLVSLDQN